LIQVFLLPFILAGSVVHGGQSAGLSFAKFAAAVFFMDYSPSEGGDALGIGSLFFVVVIVAAIAGSLGYGLPRLDRAPASAVVAMSLVVLFILAAVYVGQLPLRALVPVHAIAVTLVVWLVDRGLDGLKTARKRSWHSASDVLTVSAGVVAFAVVLIGGGVSLKRTSPEPVFETMAFAEQYARGRPIWSAGIFRRVWNDYYALRPIDFRASFPEENSVFLMLLNGHSMTPVDREAVEIVRRFGHLIGRVAPGFEVWECPPRRSVEQVRTLS
jgi:hypothetical protein